MVSFAPRSLRQYAFIADGERGALVGPQGDVAFMCAPRWHDDAAFASLIGGNGHFTVTPRSERYVWGGYHEPDSLIWRSRWVTEDSVIECRDALSFPGDRHRAVLLRRIEPVDGVARVDAIVQVAAGFGEHAMAVKQVADGVWQGRSGPLYVRWTGAPRVAATQDELYGTLDVDPSHHHDLVLEISDQPLPRELVEPDHAWAATERAWREAVPTITSSIAPGDSQHSYAVLRGLTSSDGGMAAAATMAIPERAEQGRNYDYRYAWIRDQCFTGQAAAEAGALPLLDDALRFVSARLLDHGPDLRPAYTVDGQRVPDERDLDLPGYPGGEAKVGNWVNNQFQLDAFGEALLLFTAGERHGRSDDTVRQAAQAAVVGIEKRWTEPDAGIWELDDQRWAHSRLMCAAGLRSYAAQLGGSDAQRWRSMADGLVADVNQDCLHPSGRWKRAPDDERVDAALLLPAIRGAVSRRDPRALATLEAVEHELVRDGYVYRFRHDDRPLNEAEGAFQLCGFQLAIAEHQNDMTVQAMRRFERVRASVGPPGLFTEEFDVVQRELRGNMPQGFVHALLIESASRLSRAPDPDPFDNPEGTPL
ncbi:MAG: glycoside hydrolase family 15 protein [Nocardioidaceae bacterium]